MPADELNPVLCKKCKGRGGWYEYFNRGQFKLCPECKGTGKDQTVTRMLKALDKVVIDSNNRVMLLQVDGVAWWEYVKDIFKELEQEAKGNGSRNN